MSRRPVAVAAIVVACAAWAAPLPAEEPASAEQTVSRLYELVTCEPGRTPDWDQVRSLFLPEAIVVLRSSREEMKVLSLEGFVKDFVDFIERADVERTGFTEKLVRMKATLYGDIAHVLAVYEASIPGSPRPPQQGIDSFELVRLEGRWRIAAITNEVPPPGEVVPEGLGGEPGAGGR